MDCCEACAFVETCCGVVVTHHGEVHVLGALVERLVAQLMKDCVADALASMCGAGGHALDPSPSPLDHDLTDTNAIGAETRRRECHQQAGSQEKLAADDCIFVAAASTRLDGPVRVEPPFFGSTVISTSSVALVRSTTSLVDAR